MSLLGLCAFAFACIRACVHACISLLLLVKQSLLPAFFTPLFNLPLSSLPFFSHPHMLRDLENSLTLNFYFEDCLVISKVAVDAQLMVTRPDGQMSVCVCVGGCVTQGRGSNHYMFPEDIAVSEYEHIRE